MGPAAQREPAVFHLLGKNDVYYVGIPSALTRPVTYTTEHATRHVYIYTIMRVQACVSLADSRLSRKSNVAAVACARCGVGWSRVGGRVGESMCTIKNCGSRLLDSKCQVINDNVTR